MWGVLPCRKENRPSKEQLLLDIERLKFNTVISKNIMYQIHLYENGVNFTEYKICRFWVRIPVDALLCNKQCNIKNFSVY